MMNDDDVVDGDDDDEWWWRQWWLQSTNLADASFFDDTYGTSTDPFVQQPTLTMVSSYMVIIFICVDYYTV